MSRRPTLLRSSCPPTARHASDRKERGKGRGRLPFDLLVGAIIDKIAVFICATGFPAAWYSEWDSDCRLLLRHARAFLTVWFVWLRLDSLSRS